MEKKKDSKQVKKKSKDMKSKDDRNPSILRKRHTRSQISQNEMDEQAEKFSAKKDRSSFLESDNDFASPSRKSTRNKKQRIDNSFLSHSLAEKRVPELADQTFLMGTDNEGNDADFSPIEKLAEEVKRSCSETKSNSNSKKASRLGLKYNKAPNAHQVVIKEVSQDFFLDWDSTYQKLKVHHMFIDRNTKQRKQDKNYFYYNHDQVMRQFREGTIAPGVDHPNIVLMGLFNDKVKKAHLPVLAAALEKQIHPYIQGFYADQALEEVLGDLESLSSLEEMVNCVMSVPLQILFKATATALARIRKAFPTKDDINLRRSWFSYCIKPALKKCKNVKSFALEKEEVDTIKLICEENFPENLDDEEAIELLKLITSSNQLNLDEAFKWFKDKDDQFWTSVLQNLVKIKDSVLVQTIVTHKDNMLTHSLQRYHGEYIVDLKFSNAIKRFQRLTYEELGELYSMHNNHTFWVLLRCLKDDRIYDFTLFKLNSSAYLTIHSQSQLKELEICLKNQDLENWKKFTSKIMASASFLSSDESKETLKAALQRISNSYIIPEADTSIKREIDQLWNSAFDILNQTIALQELEWQKDLTCYLYNLLANLSKKNIIVSLGTGHGKSIIIQQLAEMVSSTVNKVYVVCLNDFLAHYGRKVYGKKSLNVEAGRIVYMDLEVFLKIDPSGDDAIVIFDEIDQMLAGESFQLQEGEKTITPLYIPSVMSAWRGIVGFSGTVEQCVTQQLKEEFKTPVMITIPSLRRGGVVNKINGVFQCSDATKKKIVLERLHQVLTSEIRNAIVILENAEEVAELVKDNRFQEITATKQVFQMSDFSQNHFLIENVLDGLASDDFVVVTTKEGGRGIDMKGQTKAHVILAFESKLYSNVIQALGRGSRSLDTYSEGTIIAKNPAHPTKENYLKSLLAMEEEFAQSLKINAKVARSLHLKPFPKSPDIKERAVLAAAGEFPEDNKEHVTLVVFHGIMVRFENLMKVPKKEVIWEELRKLEPSLPKTPYQCYIS